MKHIFAHIFLKLHTTEKNREDMELNAQNSLLTLKYF